jgi:hypothetical protein
MIVNQKKLALFSLIIGLVGILAQISGCQTHEAQYISRREPAPVVASSSKVPAPLPEPAQPEPQRELFTRNKELKIRRKASINETGSLTDLNDPRAYLFGFERPIEVGTFLDVKIGSNRADAPASAPTDGSPQVKVDTKSVDEGSLIKALPNLEPGGTNKPVLVKNIKMQILERFDNGDVLVMYRRRSMQEGQGAEILVTARLPASALSRPEQVSTTDLADIDWHQSADGEVVERKSVNWEDEYSLRISGFDETKSKIAAGLEEKREQLKSVRDKLENELKAFDGERKLMTTERAGLLEKKAQDTAKIEDLNKQNAELKKEVDDLKPKDEADLTAADPKADPKATAQADPKKNASAAKAVDPKADAKSPKKAETKAPEKPKDTKKAAAKPAAANAAKG